MAYICVGVACPSVEGTWFCELFKNGGLHLPLVLGGEV